MAEVEGSSPFVPTFNIIIEDNMTQTSMKEQIKKLVELQAIDKEIYDYKRQLKEFPERLAQLKEQFETKKESLKRLDEELKTKQLERKEKEVDLQAKEEEIAKSNSQLSQLKTNKEYKAKLTEIEGQKADKSIIEEKILILFDEVDKIKITQVGNQEESAKKTDPVPGFTDEDGDGDEIIDDAQVIEGEENPDEDA